MELHEAADPQAFRDHPYFIVSVGCGELARRNDPDEHIVFGAIFGDTQTNLSRISTEENPGQPTKSKTRDRSVP